VTSGSKLFQNYVNGHFVSGPREFADINPADGSTIAEVSEADESLVNQAVESARNALNRNWGKLPVPSRAALLHKVADGIEARFRSSRSGGHGQTSCAGLED